MWVRGRERVGVGVGVRVRVRVGMRRDGLLQPTLVEEKVIELRREEEK